LLDSLLKENDMVEVDEGSLLGRRFSAEEKKGTVLFEGAVGETKGVWLGVEWDDPTRGKHDGTHEGVRYFQPRHTSPTSSSFLRINKVNLGVNLLEGVRMRYGKVEGETAGVGQEFIDDLQKEIGARFVQVVGFDKVNTRQSQLDKLKSVSVGYMDINDTHVEISSALTSMRDLDLSGNLISSWSCVSELVAQVPLRVLNLSSNLLPATSSIPVEKFAHLSHLILGDMGYDWSEVERIAGDLSSLENLQVHRNKIKQISVSEGKFLTLKGLDLDSNLIEDWSEVNNLSSLRTLEYLQVNDNKISSIDLQDSSFENLKGLQIGFNLISDWSHVSQLNRLTLSELRFRNNPVLQQEKQGEGRSTIVVLIRSLKVLNGSTIQDTERKWAEIDYYKKHGLEYLRIMKLPEEERNLALETFSGSRGRYMELVKKFGEPTEGELKVKERNLKASLVQVKIRSLNLEDSKEMEKKLPLNMTVAKLRALIGRLFRKDSGGAELNLRLQSFRSPEQEEDLDNDLRELAYFSLETGDTILVSW
jgi:Leucine-rich repeat (LRR) protein